jgi:hypothetical protein
VVAGAEAPLTASRGDPLATRARSALKAAWLAGPSELRTCAISRSTAGSRSSAGPAGSPSALVRVRPP